MATVYYTATTLDGFLADPDDSLDWLMRQDLTSVKAGDADAFDYERFIGTIGALAMGATTYRWVRDHLAGSGEKWPYSQPTWVFTHRDLEQIPGADVRFAKGPVEQWHAELAAVAGDANVWVVGGGGLAADFARAGLLDEVLVSIAPVTLGAGRPLFPGRFDLELLGHARVGGFLCGRYRVLGTLAEDR